MANDKNLIPGGHKFTLDEASRGGKKSAQVRRERKAFKKIFEELLAGELSADLAAALNEKSGALGIDTSEFTVAEYIGLAQIVKAIGGDGNAFEAILGIIGEKPADKNEISVKELPSINLVRKK